MDDQHKRFFVLINELHQGLKQGKGADVLGGILNELARYTEYHFSAEEALLEQAGYPELPQQKEAHRRFIDKVQDFQRRYATGDRSVPVEAMNAVRDWLVSHIQKMDKKYGSCVNTGSAGYGSTPAAGRPWRSATGTPTA
jgi:hemerythrin